MRWGRTLHVTSVEDLPELHQEVVIGGAGLYWRSKGRMMGGQEFGDLLFSGVPLSAVARDADGSLVALLEVVSLDVESGHAELAAVVASGYRRSSAVIDVAGPFCAEAFRKFPIRKLYALFSEGSGVEPSSLERLGFVLEGTLREYVWIDGAHRDVSVCAVDRSTVELRVRATSVEVTGLAVLPAQGCGRWRCTSLITDSAGRASPSRSTTGHGDRFYLHRPGDHRCLHRPLQRSRQSGFVLDDV